MFETTKKIAGVLLSRRLFFVMGCFWQTRGERRISSMTAIFRKTTAESTILRGASLSTKLAKMTPQLK